MEGIKLFLNKQKAKASLRKAFKNAGLYMKFKNGDKDVQVFPKIHSVQFDDEKKTTTYVFDLVRGMDPKEVIKKHFVFMQHFGKNIDLDGDHKTFELIIYENGIKRELTYKFKDIQPIIEGMKVPIVCGIDKNGEWVAYDAKTEPNALISGEPGSGKSTQLRSILCTLIQSLSPDDLHLYLGDLKMSEFHLFKGVKHVKNISVFPDELEVMLARVYSDMIRRSKLLNSSGVMHVDDLPQDKKVPYILVAIDEIVMVMDNKEIKSMLVQIDSLGRALGIYNILSLQRPSHDILDTKVRSLLTVRMGFRTTDLSNAKIIGTPGSETISRETPGRFFLKRDTLSEIQAPYLTDNRAKKLLERYKSNEPVKEQVEDAVKPQEEIQLREEDVFFDEINEA